MLSLLTGDVYLTIPTCSVVYDRTTTGKLFTTTNNRFNQYVLVRQHIVTIFVIATWEKRVTIVRLTHRVLMIDYIMMIIPSTKVITDHARPFG